jgi:diguanylate cyclase (GGDEF)-like protein
MQALFQNLDIGTLLVVHQMLAIVSAVVIFAGAIHANGRFGLWFWFGSFAATAFFQLLRDYGPTSQVPGISTLMGQLGVLFNAAFIALAVKSYLGRPLSWAPIAIGSALCVTVLFFLALSGMAGSAALALTLLAAGVLTALALRDLLQAYRAEGGFALAFGTVLIALLLMRLVLRAGTAFLPFDGDGDPDLSVNAIALLAFIAALAMQGFAILMLVNDDLQKKMLALAEYDELTGLLNRRGMSNRFKRLLDWARRDGAPQINLAIIDMDHFKAINDHLGHAAGDQVLIELAKRLQELVRPNDLCVRMGGEEFAVFWTGVPADMAAAMAERIRLAISFRPFQTREGLLRCSVSIGLCRMKPEESLDDFIDRADQALYVAKEGGRNKVVVLPS